MDNTNFKAKKLFWNYSEVIQELIFEEIFIQL